MKEYLIQALSIFSHSQLWRVRGKRQVSNTFGGVVSLLIYALIGVLLVLKLIEVFSKATIANSTTYSTAKSIDAVNTEFISENISTYQNDSINFPFMIALESRTPSLIFTNNLL